MTKKERLAFQGCTNLKEIYCYNFSKDWNGAFDKSLVGDTTIHVPKHALGSVLVEFGDTKVIVTASVEAFIDAIGKFI